MSCKVFRIAFAASLALAFSAPIALVGIPAGIAAEKPVGTPGKESDSQRAKKPGETCEKLAKDSQAYKDCIKGRAQDNKTTPKAGDAKVKGKGTDKQ